MKKLYRVNLTGWKRWPKCKYRWPSAERNLANGWVWHEVPGGGGVVKRKVLSGVLKDWDIMFGWVVELEEQKEIYGTVTAKVGLLIEEDHRKFLIFMPGKTQMDAEPFLKPYVPWAAK